MPASLLASDLSSPEGHSAAPNPTNKHTVLGDRQTPKHQSPKDGETVPGFAALVLADIKMPLPEAPPTEQSAPAGNIPAANVATRPGYRTVQLDVPAPVLASGPAQDAKNQPAKSAPIPTIAGPVAATSATPPILPAGSRPVVSDKPAIRSAPPEQNHSVDVKNLADFGSDGPREISRTPGPVISLQSPQAGPEIGRLSDSVAPPIISSGPQPSAPLHTTSSASVHSTAQAPSPHLHHSTAPGHQLVAAIKTHTNENRLEVRLDPPHLGKLSIEFDIRPDAPVRAIVSAENSDTLSQLRRQSSYLLRELSASGLDNVDLAFSDTPHDQPSFHDNQFVPIFSHSDEADAVDLTTTSHPIQRPLSGLDIRL